MANMNFKANILPATSQGYNLGSSTQQWVIHGPIYTNGIFGTENIDYGATLPSTATEGQIFFQTSNTVIYSVPAGGQTGYALIKESSADGDFSWQPVSQETYSVLMPEEDGTDASLVTTGEKYNWNNAGTVKSVQIQATAPISSSNAATQNSIVSTTISLANNYGDTKNPYASKAANSVLAAPNGASGTPSFRTLVEADIPTINISTKTSGTLPINRGGTGADNATGAWTNLGGGDIGKLNAGAASATATFLAQNGTWLTPPGTYTLPKATDSLLGGITVGDGLSVTNGNISVDWSDAPVASVNGTTGTVVLSDLVIGSSHYNGSTTVTVSVTDLGLTAPMTFRGVTDTIIVDGANVSPINIISGGTIGSLTPANGDVVLQKDEQIEYLYTGSAWTALGIASSYSLAEHAHGYIVNDGTMPTTVTATTGDYLLIADANDYNRIVSAGNLTFDASAPYSALSRAGTWVDFLQLSGGTMTGALKTKGLVGTLDYDYGEVLPSTAVEGQLFFQISDGDDLELPSGGTAGCALVKNSNTTGDYSWKYILPTGGTAGQVLIKNSNADGDTTWGTITANDRVLKAGDTMTGNLTMSGSSINFNWQNATRANNTIYTVGNLSFKNADNSVVYSAPWLRFMGTNGTDGYNTCVLYGSTNGTTWLTAGESGSTLPTALSAYNDENLYLSADGAIRMYSGCSNDAATRPLTLECRANGYAYATRLYGAVWNDYAEFRKDNIEEKELQQPGRCVKENGNGTLSLTQKRLERGCEIISDTFGFSIGQDEENGYNTPIASNGRVLAYPYEPIEEFRNHIGWPVCSGPNGTVSIMTEEEEEKYPSRIVGMISEIPDYQIWGSGNVEVNNRIWIRIR